MDNSKSKVSGLYCLVMMMQYFQQPVDISALQHEFSDDDFDIITLIRAARKLNLKARKVIVKPKRLHKYNFPFIACNNDGEFFILAGIRDNQALIQKPGEKPATLPIEELWSIWNGLALMLANPISMVGDNRRFDLSWFIPSIARYRKIIRGILLASLAIQIFALMMPLGYQVVMDKVLAHNALKTLDVLTIGLLIVAVFELTLGGLRSYLFNHTTSKIDIELGSKLFDHLLKLPQTFFQTHAVGQIVQRVQELESIRNFLTGNALMLLLDVLFSIVFFGVMFLYSPTLTWIVIASVPLYILISVLLTPEIRRRTEERFQRAAASQSFLTETITGIETIKAMAVEPKIRLRWEDHLAAYVKATFSSSVLNIHGGIYIELISKIVALALMWKGAQLVLEEQLTVGELIAFNMLSSQVAAPILRLAQLWQEFQQFRVSMERLGDLLNAPVEPQLSLNHPSMPDIEGKIEFREVTFRYLPDRPEVLRKLSLTIQAGESIGIAGVSGSGKSTLLKLIQRLFIPESGRIYIDGNDVALLNPAWLRKQVGVVLQENTLFNRSVRENIALSTPGESMENIIRAARLAGAHEFIIELPQGYDTELGERGVGLSGGQRQRIAIARAILTNPKILVLDEATSALDYESESVVQNNMGVISAGRTVITIAHRLSAIRHCDRIIVLERGQIIESGDHDQLLRKRGRYASLWEMQSGDNQSKGV